MPRNGSTVTGQFLNLVRLAVFDFALDSSSNDKELDSSRLELLAKHFDRSVDVDRSTAVEQIDGSVSVLRPSVDRVVRFLDYDRARNAVRHKFVERIRHNRRFRSACRVHHCSSDRFRLFERLLVAIKELNQKVRAERRLFVLRLWQALDIVTEPIVKGVSVFTVDELPASIVFDAWGCRNCLQRRTPQELLEPSLSLRICERNDDGRNGGASDNSFDGSQSSFPHLVVMPKLCFSTKLGSDMSEPNDKTEALQAVRKPDKHGNRRV